MTTHSLVLVLDEDPAPAEALQAAFSGDSGVRVRRVEDDASAVRIIRNDPPHLLVVSETLLIADEGARIRKLRGNPGRPLLVARMVRPEAVPEGGPVADLGADEVLEWPLPPAELRARLRSALRLARAEERLGVERERLRQANEGTLGRMVRLITDLCDMRRPGAAERGNRLAALVAQVAERFEVPEEFRLDLELAARLHELGHLVTREEHQGTSPVGTEGWSTAAAAREILRRVEGLAGAAEVLGAVCENWDGTGLPDHRLQGQIPLRSRILRAGIDYLAALDRGHDTPPEILANLLEHKGSRYDPLVLVHLEAILTGLELNARHADCRVIPITSLEVGMVLADDLYTATGIKLLSRGARLGPSALESIQRRHRAEPIHHGATVRRTGT